MPEPWSFDHLRLCAEMAAARLAEAEESGAIASGELLDLARVLRQHFDAEVQLRQRGGGQLQRGGGQLQRGGGQPQRGGGQHQRGGDLVAAARERAFEQLVTVCGRGGISERAFALYLTTAYPSARGKPPRDALMAWKAENIRDVAQKIDVAIGDVSLSLADRMETAGREIAALSGHSVSAREAIDEAIAQVHMATEVDPLADVDAHVAAVLILGRRLRHERRDAAAGVDE